MWIDRRWQSFRRRSLVVQLLIAGTTLASPFLCCVSWGRALREYQWRMLYTQEDRDFVLRGRDGSSGGLPSVARRLKSEMAQIPDPDTAIRLHPDWAALRFADGEWVFGHGMGATGFRIGHGTIVLKDSRGRIRVYFGIVSGSNGPFHMWGNAKGLDEFDMWLRESTEFREWIPN